MDVLSLTPKGLVRLHIANSNGETQGPTFSSDYRQMKEAEKWGPVFCAQCQRVHPVGQHQPRLVLVTEDFQMAHFYEQGYDNIDEADETTFRSFCEERGVRWGHIEVVYLPHGLAEDPLGPILSSLGDREGPAAVVLQLGASLVAVGIKKTTVRDKLFELADQIAEAPVYWKGRRMKSDVASHQVLPVTLPILPTSLTIPPALGQVKILRSDDESLVGEALQDVQAHLVPGNVLKYFTPVFSIIKKEWVKAYGSTQFPPDSDGLAIRNVKSTIILNGKEEQITSLRWDCAKFSLNNAQCLQREVLWSYMLKLREHMIRWMVDPDITRIMDDSLMDS